MTEKFYKKVNSSSLYGEQVTKTKTNKFPEFYLTPYKDGYLIHQRFPSGTELCVTYASTLQKAKKLISLLEDAYI